MNTERFRLRTFLRRIVRILLCILGASTVAPFDTAHLLLSMLNVWYSHLVQIAFGFPRARPLATWLLSDAASHPSVHKTNDSPLNLAHMSQNLLQDISDPRQTLSHTHWETIWELVTTAYLIMVYLIWLVIKRPILQVSSFKLSIIVMT